MKALQFKSKKDFCSRFTAELPEDAVAKAEQVLNRGNVGH
jgi:hypothetical protein